MKKLNIQKELKNIDTNFSLSTSKGANIASFIWIIYWALALGYIILKEQ